MRRIVCRNAGLKPRHIQHFKSLIEPLLGQKTRFKIEQMSCLDQTQFMKRQFGGVVGSSRAKDCCCHMSSDPPADDPSAPPPLLRRVIRGPPKRYGSDREYQSRAALRGQAAVGDNRSQSVNCCRHCSLSGVLFGIVVGFIGAVLLWYIVSPGQPKL